MKRVTLDRPKNLSHFDDQVHRPTTDEAFVNVNFNHILEQKLISFHFFKQKFEPGV